MIRTGDEYRESIRDGREVWVNGERVEDVTTEGAAEVVVAAATALAESRIARGHRAEAMVEATRAVYRAATA